MSVQFKTDKIQTNNQTATTRNCDICSKSGASYSCPRCNIPYCSLTCYRHPTKHVNCSENFYQEQVIQELKMCKLEDKSDRGKMVEILKKVAKEYEGKGILPGEDGDEESGSDTNSEGDRDNEDDTNLETNLNDNQLIRAYENEVVKWTPWWHAYKEPIMTELTPDSVETTTSFQFNSSLVKKSLKINAQNANPLIFNDIMSLFYAYSIVAYVYQIEEVHNKLDENGHLNDEIVINLIKIDRVLRTKVPRGTTQSLGQVINYSVKACLDETDLFFKEFVSGSFLTGLIDEVILVSESPSILSKFISNLYDLFSHFQKSSSLPTNKPSQIAFPAEEPEDDTPLNVFFLNKKVTEIRRDQSGPLKKSRVKIISTPTENKVQEYNQKIPISIESNSSQDYRAMLKRLEFYYQWLNLNKASLKAFGRERGISGELGLVKESLVKEIEQMEREKEFVDENLSKIRWMSQRKEFLVEEI